MFQFRRDDTLRYLAAGSIALLGVALAGIPLYDIWDDITNLSWVPLATLAENAPFLVLAGSLVAGGIWLSRADLTTEQVITVVRRTVLITVLVAAVMGWGAYSQILTMGALKPSIIGLNGVLISSVASFAVAVSSVRAREYRQTARVEENRADQLVEIYDVATALEGTSTHEEAYSVVEQGLGDALHDEPFRIVVDGEHVVEHGAIDGSAEQSMSVAIGSRGRIELTTPVDTHDEFTAELVASHLDEALRRIDRETKLREERNVLEFVNRTLRHDLTSDLTLVRARLRMVDQNVSFREEANEKHHTVALDRVDEMNEYVSEIRTYMESVLGDNHTLDAVALASTVDDQLTALQQQYPEAEIRNEGLPPVTVTADKLLDRVFANVLTNAVEHNDASTPRVVVDGERDGDVVRVRIADNGPGFSADRPAGVFERGERGAESDGTGFGLYLVKTAVENYGGSVRVRDNDPRGAVVELSLPVASEE